MGAVVHLPPSKAKPQKASLSLNRDDVTWGCVVHCSVVGCQWHVPALDVTDAVNVLATHLQQCHDVVPPDHLDYGRGA